MKLLVAVAVILAVGRVTPCNAAQVRLHCCWPSGQAFERILKRLVWVVGVFGTL